MKNVGTKIVKELRKRVTILPFHAAWIRAAFEPEIQISALSVSRGNAKSWLIGNLAAQCLDPQSVLFEKGLEDLVVSGSREQSRIIMTFLRDALDQFPNANEYRVHDSPQRAWATHVPTGTRVRVLSSSGKRAMGLVFFRRIFCDEPGSWASREGALMWDALRTSLGKKPGQRILLIGTKSPSEPDTWWPAMLQHGSVPGTHVHTLAADSDEPWDSWKTINKVNPLLRHNPDLKKTVKRERLEARKNSHLRPVFEAYRLNRHRQTDVSMLLEVEDWKKVEARPVPPRAGSPVVGLDLGSNRSWSAAWCLWKNGRSEAFALCPGIPDLATRERQDAMPRGFYQKLYDDGVLILEREKRIAKPGTLLQYLVEEQGLEPDTIYSDRFILDELKDVIAGRFPVVARQTRWSEATSDITAFRKLAYDGPLSIDEKSRGLVRMSLSKAVLKSDEQGSAFLKKRQSSASRDDVAQCGILVCGALSRVMTREQAEADHQPVGIRYRVCGAAA